MAAETYTKSGTKATTPVKLDSGIFGLKVVNHQLLKNAYLAHLAGGRANYAKTKKRGEVQGGGKKPYSQKGTGRARFGSSRNPIWTGGGVAFGPTGQENYSHKINTKTRRQALKQALSLASTENRIKIIDSIDFAEGKIKPIVALLGKMGATGNTLLVVDQKDILAERSTRNLPSVRLVNADYLSVMDALNADTIIITKTAVDMVQNRLGGAHE